MVLSLFSKELDVKTIWNKIRLEFVYTNCWTYDLQLIKHFMKKYYWVSRDGGFCRIHMEKSGEGHYFLARGEGVWGHLPRNPSNYY